MTSPEDLARLIEQTVRAVLAGVQGAPQQTAGGYSGGVNRRLLEAKGVSRVDTFTGKESQWKEWSFQFRVAIKAMDSRVSDIMSKCEGDEQGRSQT